MSVSGHKGLIAGAACVVAGCGVFFCAAAAQAQSRNRVTLGNPGTLSTIGQGSSTYRFQQYSSGIGALGQAASSPLGGGSVLRSSIGTGTSLYVTSRPLDTGATGIGNRGLMNQPLGAGVQGGMGRAPALRGTGASAPRGGSYSRYLGTPNYGQISSSNFGQIANVGYVPRSGILDSPLVSKPLYSDQRNPLALSKSTDWSTSRAMRPRDPLSMKPSVTGGPIGSALPDPGSEEPTLIADTANTTGGVGRALAAQINSPSAFGLARGFVQALERASSSLLRQQSEPITSLVPPKPSVYRTYMVRGDRAFRQGNFREAYANFQIANDLGNKDPESFICLLHAEFALSSVSYVKAAYFLEQALRHMPELPLSNLRPRGFYGSQAKYAQQIVALSDHVAENPNDHEAMIVLAYFRWFEQDRDVEMTKRILENALAAAENKKDPLMIEAITAFWRGAVATGEATGELTPTPGEARTNAIAGS